MNSKINIKPTTVNCEPSTIIVANGKFPEHEIPLNLLHKAEIVVCCDGAIAKLDKNGIEPTIIVGDLDSLSDNYRSRFAAKLSHDPDQNTNDLTKAIKWCKSNNLSNIYILGATGIREDHTLGNIGLLPSYARMGMQIRLITDNGVIIPLIQSSTLESFKGQQISIFSPNNLTRITTTNLKYPIVNSTLDELWMGTLNESLGDTFTIEFNPGPLILFQSY